MKTLIAVAALLVFGSAQSHTTDFKGSFAPEAVGATGSGTLFLQYDHDGQTLLIDATFTGLSGTTTVAHIHCCTANPNTGTAGVALGTGSPLNLPGWPAGVSSGSYLKVIDLTSTANFSATFLTGSGGTAAGAEKRLIDNLSSGNAYFNIHSTTFPGGEIRTFVTVVPEPATYGLMLAGLAGVVGLARRRSA